MELLVGAALAVTLILALGLWSTLRKLAAQREANQRSATILAGIADSFFALDRDGRFTFITAKAGEVLGMSPEDAIGRTFTAFPELRDSELYRHVTDSLQSGLPTCFEQFHPLLNRWFEQQIYINPDRGVAVFGRDITSRRRIEEALRASEERFQRLVNANVMGVCVSNGTNVTEANDLFLEMAGYDRNDLVRGQISWPESMTGVSRRETEIIRKDGRRVPVLMGSIEAESETLYVVHDLTDLKRAEVRLRQLVEATKILNSSFNLETMMNELARFLSPGLGDQCVIYIKEDNHLRRAASAGWDHTDVLDSPQMETVLNKGRSEIVPSAVIIVPLPSRSRIAGAIFIGVPNSHAIGHDDMHLFEEIGRRAGISLENAQLYNHTQVASRLKDEFVAALSHELRTPLTPILGAVYMLKTEPENKRIVNKAVDLIERNARTQAKIVEDLLDMSRIISGKLRLRQEPVELETAIRSAVDAVEPARDAKKIQMKLLLNPINGVVYGDPDRLQQIFWNLLSNSVKFTPTGGSITIELHQNEEHAEARVTDTGKGIAEEFLPYVFDRFRQEDTARNKMHGGLGIGLAIVRHLVESHGGTVHAHSLGNQKGSTFVIRFPLRPSLGRETRSRTASHA